MAGKNSLKKITQLVQGRGVEKNTSKPAIEVKDLTKIFGNFTSVEDVSFTVNHGVIHGFIGPNGSGKTTTIKSLIGAYLPTKGDLFVNGEKAASKGANQAIGYIPERASFPKHLNALQYLTTMGQLSGIKKKESKSKALEILNFLKLGTQAKRKPTTFSSGMQKKVLLAQALLTDPSILILDEPAANLDPSSRAELFQQLVDLRDQGKTIFISSHVLAELEKIVDEITFIYYGNLLFSGTVKEFNSRSTSIFLKVDDESHDLIIKFLEKKKFEYSGTPKTEIEILKIKNGDSQHLLNEIVKSKIKVISFRANDLQASYEEVSKNANINNKNNQRIEKNIIKNMKHKYFERKK